MSNNTELLDLSNETNPGFSNIKINQPLPAPVHSILKVILKFRSQL